MTIAKRTFFKPIGLNGTIGAGVGFGLNSEIITLSAVNKCRITSFGCVGVATDDTTQLSVDFSLLANITLPSWVGTADKEQIVRNGSSVFCDDKKLLECYLDVPTNYGLQINATLSLRANNVNNVNFAIFIIINYEEEIFD